MTLNTLKCNHFTPLRLERVNLKKPVKRRVSFSYSFHELSRLHERTFWQAPSVGDLVIPSSHPASVFAISDLPALVLLTWGNWRGQMSVGPLTVHHTPLRRNTEMHYAAENREQLK